MCTTRLQLPTLGPSPPRVIEWDNTGLHWLYYWRSRFHLLHIVLIGWYLDAADVEEKRWYRIPRKALGPGRLALHRRGTKIWTGFLFTFSFLQEMQLVCIKSGGLKSKNISKTLQAYPSYRSYDARSSIWLTCLAHLGLLASHMVPQQSKLLSM